MNKTVNSIPRGWGMINGLYLSLNQKSLIAVKDSNLNVKFLSRWQTSNLIKVMSKIIFLRGIFFFFFNLYSYFKCFDQDYNHFNKNLLKLNYHVKVKERRNVSNFYIFLALCFLVYFLIFPIMFNAVFSEIYISFSLKIFLTMLFKFFMVICFLLTLKTNSLCEKIFKINYAINKNSNAYSKSGGLNYNAINKASPYVVFSASNSFLFSFLIVYLIISPLTLSASIALNVVFKILLTFGSISVAYEAVIVVEYLYRDYFIFRLISYFFKFLSMLTAMPCKDGELNMCKIAMEELEQMNIDELDTSPMIGTKSISFSNVLFEVKQRLLQAGITDESEAQNLICDTLKIKRGNCFLIKALSKSEYDKILKVLLKRIQHQPLTKILKVSNFYGYNFFVNGDVLSPRQETELLVENVIKYVSTAPKLKNGTMLDLCTGSGAIAIVVAKHTELKVTATDISKKALLVAQKNAKNLNTNINFICSNMFEHLKVDKKFDIITCNPPYIATSKIEELDCEVKNFDPLLSLDGGVDGLKFYRIIAYKAKEFLKKNGRLFLEIGFDQAQEVLKILNTQFCNIQVVEDYSGLPRVVVATKK